MELTIKQEKFCLEYAACGNATEAYKRAGYAVSSNDVASVNANRLLRNAKVKIRMEELMKEVATNKIADITEIQEFLTSVLRQERTEEEIVVTGEVSEVKEKKIPISAAIRAAELLAKMQGAFRNEINITGSVPVIISGEDSIAD